MLQMLDMLSDCFLVIDFNLHHQIEPDKGYDIMSYFCMCFIIIPCILSLFQIHYYSQTVWLENDKVMEWLIKYSKFLYIISVFTGSSFTAISIMNSSIFGLSYFEMGLTFKEIIRFRHQRVYSVILFEVKITLYYVISFNMLHHYKKYIHALMTINMQSV